MCKIIVLVRPEPKPWQKKTTPCVACGVLLALNDRCSWTQDGKVYCVSCALDQG